MDSTPTIPPLATIPLFDLMIELSAAGGSESEVVAAVVDLLETGRVRFSRGLGPVLSSTL